MNATLQGQVDNNFLFTDAHIAAAAQRQLKKVYKQFLSKIQESCPHYLIDVHKSNDQIIAGYKTGYQDDIKEFIRQYTEEEGGENLFCLQPTAIPQFLCNNEINIVSSSKPNINVATLTCFAQDQHLRNFVITAKHALSEQNESKLSFNGGVLHFRHKSSKDQYIHCSVCYGIHKGCKLENSKIKVQIDIAVILLPNIELSDMKKLDIIENSNSLLDSCNGNDSEDDSDDSENDDGDYDMDDLDGCVVEKKGAATGLTRGIIYKSNHSVRGREGLFSVLFAEENKCIYEVNGDKPFACDGDSGALVNLVKKEKKLSLGIVYASCEPFSNEYKCITYCIKLNNCLTALKERWGLELTLYENPIINNSKALFPKEQNRKRCKSQ